jgi:NADPH:quinone reductase-like Zn-dependent oxidoreductase
LCNSVAGFAYGTHHPTNGSYAEYVRYRASATLALPAAMSYAQGAALPIPHMTAVQALYMRMHLPPPSQGGAAGRMLIWGGGTAVGHHAIQLAKLSGLDVVAVASKSNHEALKSLGASHCVDYHDSDVVKQIQAVGKIEYGLDCVVEKGSTKNMIGAPHTLSRPCVRSGD